MNNDKKQLENFQKFAKNTFEFTSKKIEEAKEYTSDVIMPTIKDSALKTRNVLAETSDKISDTIKTNITEEQMLEILNTLYIKSVNGIPKVSLKVEDLVDDYLSKNNNIDLASKSLINNSIVKCGTSGFLSSFGGFASMIVTLPANVTTVLYVQLRMCCAIAKMAGYDIHSDQVQTLIYACLTGSAASDILKQAGIKFGNKFGIAMVKKIPGKTLTAINRKVGFRFVTKFGEKGIVNLGKVVPVLGGVIGGGIDIASTRLIGLNAYNIFIKGQMPSKENLSDDIIEEKAIEVDDIDTKTLNEAVKNKEQITSSEINFEELKKLKKLLDLKIITNEEFEQKKKELLNL